MPSTLLSSIILPVATTTPPTAPQHTRSVRFACSFLPDRDMMVSILTLDRKCSLGVLLVQPKIPSFGPRRFRHTRRLCNLLPAPRKTNATEFEKRKNRPEFSFPCQNSSSHSPQKCAITDDAMFAHHHSLVSPQRGLSSFFDSPKLDTQPKSPVSFTPEKFFCFFRRFACSPSNTLRSSPILPEEKKPSLLVLPHKKSG